MDSGIIIDVETTGLDPRSDRIIEIGVIAFDYDFSKNLVQITNTYGALQDPERPLSEQIVQLTGLSDEVLTGRKIDWNLVATMIADASVVIAHNAEFDAAFLLRIPQLQSLRLKWGCSLRHIDWESKGFKTRKLSYLAADSGFLNPFPHRAVFDCATTLRVITPFLNELVENCQQRDYRIVATNAPFESKDLLKARGYTWDVSQRVWSRILSEKLIEAERSFLVTEVYRHSHHSHVEQILPPLGGSPVDSI